jgi:murein DD-endopeptidase MepM/ murein hydrolase activator NlpD
MDAHPAHRARTAPPPIPARPAHPGHPAAHPGCHRGAHSHRTAVRLLVALMGLVLVAALQMTVPAHGDPGAAGGSAAAEEPEGSGDPAPGTSASARARWDWPMASPHRIIAPFVAPENRYGPGHRGVDIVGGGTEVRAVEDGTVRFAGPVAGRGVISILHADGLLSTYEPVTASVSTGDHVRAGQVVGQLEGADDGGAGGDRDGGADEGGTGEGPGAGHYAQACLHLGARRGGADYVDPEPLLRGADPSVLLPLEGVATALVLLAGRGG